MINSKTSNWSKTSLLQKFTLLFLLFLSSNAKIVCNNDEIYPADLSVLVIDMQGIFRGSEIYNLALYDHLKHEGVDAHIFVRSSSKIQKELASKKIPYHCPSKESRGSIAEVLRQIVIENNIDLIHCTSPSDTRNARTATEGLNTKVVLTNHMGSKSSHGSLSHLDGLICVNPQVAKDSANQNNKRRDKVIWIPPFFEEDRFRSETQAEDRVAYFKDIFNIDIKEGVPIIACIAQIGAHKNQQLIVKAMGILKNKRGIETQAIFAGNGSKTSIMKVAEAEGLNSNVHLPGFTKNVPGILANSDINILVSKMEGLGIALIEGAIMRLPSICCNIPGPRSVVINGKTGITIKPNDVQGLADALEVLCTDPEMYEKFSAGIYEHFLETFSTKVTIKKILDFYKHILTS